MEVTNIICDRVELAGSRSLSEKLIKQVKEMVSCLERACQKTGATLTIETEGNIRLLNWLKVNRYQGSYRGRESPRFTTKLVASGEQSDANYLMHAVYLRLT